MAPLVAAALISAGSKYLGGKAEAKQKEKDFNFSMQDKILDEDEQRRQQAFAAMNNVYQKSLLG